ncbi:MAG: type II toxin-antitoxin system RelE/ParE family toxin [Burkholderiaceae bacterium]|nr:type II toxin-antitoxin system RelE/ParE family toxin [Burkholderiaceae bacterium]
MQTVVELPEFIRRVTKILSVTDREEVIAYLSENPLSGVLIQETGGLRKLRWSRAGHGKRSGARIVYYFHNESMPLYLLTVFAKGERENMSKDQRNQLAKLTTVLVQTWKRTQR